MDIKKFETAKYKKLKKETENIYEQYINKYKEAQHELINQINLQGKYIVHYCFSDKSTPEYLYVNEEFHTKDLVSGRPIIILRGPGFYTDFTGFADADSFDYNAFYEIKIPFDNKNVAIDFLKNIDIIDKNDYIKAWNNAYDKLKNRPFMFLTKYEN